MKVTSERT